MRKKDQRPLCFAAASLLLLAALAELWLVPQFLLLAAGG